jgi:adhesin/invasin
MNLKTRTLFACVQIVLQFLPPSSLLYFSPVLTANAQEIAASADKKPAQKEEQNADSMAQAAIQAGALLSGDNASDALGSAVVSAATGKAASSVQAWLSQFGTARVNILTDEKFSLSDADLDLLVPLYNEKENLVFTQFGGRRHDDRNSVNGGLGYRHFNDKWMWGSNVFYDQQVSGNQHQRLGLGAEMGWDYLKLSTNGYFRLSDWMSSSQYEDYDERVANGFDLRTTGYLPSWPQLGANIIYEQYYGDNVGLFGDDEDDRQTNPYAVTLGVNYTPVPLVTMGLNQKMGKSGENDTQLNLALTWTPGVSLRTQLDPSQVALRRTLQGGRMELVDRNNNIVLEYRKQELISLSLASTLTGAERSRQTVTAQVKAKHGLDRIEWQGDSFFSHGGKITAGDSPAQFVMTLPFWQGEGVNSYTLNATAWDKKGNASRPEQINVTVNGIDATTLQSVTTLSPATIPADGKSTATVSVALKTAAGEAATGLASRLTATLLASAKTAGSLTTSYNAPKIDRFIESGKGVYTAILTSGTTPDTLTIQPLIDGTTRLSTARLKEEATVTIAQLAALEASTTSALASGSAPITLTARVTDQYGKALQGTTIDWSADTARAVLSTPQTRTDESGIAQIQVTSIDVISTLVTAQLEGGNALVTPSLSFDADVGSAQVAAISSEKQQVIANNDDTNTLTAQVTDSYGHPLPNVTVNWTIEKTDSTPVSSKTSLTDISGNALLELKSSKTGTITVRAAVKGSAAKTLAPIDFVADTSTQTVSLITLNKKQALANGTDSITYQATVTDAKGNAVQGATVSWAADNKNATLSETQTTSGTDGKSQITVTSVKAGDVVVTVQTRESTAKRADKITFIADTATAQVSAISSDKTTALANGVNAITVSATLVDANGNALSGENVAWKASPASGKLTADSTTTDSRGVAQVQLTSASVDKFTVEASANGSRQSLPSLSFTADNSTAQVSTLTADKTTDIVADKDSVNLTAQIVDAQQHPLAGSVVNWRSSDPSGSLSVNSSVTGTDGKATVSFSSLKAGAVNVTASSGNNSQVQTLQVIGNQETAQVTGIAADKEHAVADGADAIAWTATVTDANGNALTGTPLNWSASLEGATLAPASSSTDANGNATTKGTSLKSGTVKITASPVANSAGKKTGGDTLFEADAKTARLVFLTPSSSRVVINGPGVTYSAMVNDANDNPVINESVSWSTNLNTLSAPETKTDSTGKTNVTLKGDTMGLATVTATANETTLTDNSVTFSAIVEYDWKITGTTSRYVGDNITSSPSVGFLPTGNLKGPMQLVWSGAKTSSTLMIAMTDDKGVTRDVTFKGQRGTGCGNFQFNDAVTCALLDNYPMVEYSASDNPGLPSGHYSGHITFNGVAWHTGSPLLAYDVNTSLTIN